MREMAMAAVSCAAGLSSLRAIDTACSSSASTSFSTRSSSEPCVACMRSASNGVVGGLPGSRAIDYVGSSSRRSIEPSEKSRRRLEVVSQATTPSPTLSFPERSKNLNTSDLSQELSTSSRRNGKVALQDGKAKLDLVELVAPVAEDLRLLNDNLQKIVGADNPMLMAAAKQIFGAGGKRMRPALVFLVSRATCELSNIQYVSVSTLQIITSPLIYFFHYFELNERKDGFFRELRPQHRRLAETTEMIHTASLIHDDVLDESDTRRGKETVHQTFGTRIAVLAGDFMFAQASWYLANLDNLEVIKLISQVIKDFASGEIKQAQCLFDTEVTLQNYLEKSYYKTASLIAASTKSAAIFSDSTAAVCSHMFEYGMNLGLAFQVVDDILDFTQTSEQLGKPAGSDLSKGNLTAPVLFALEKEPSLRELIDSEFVEEGSLESAIALVHRGGGIDRARELAQQHADMARQSLQCLPNDSVARQSLESMVDYVLDRIF